jgi:GPH family glycoside/pentoside/hexuronide:cation symporter
MAVMTGDDKERTSIGSSAWWVLLRWYAGAGRPAFLVAYFGNINPTVKVDQLEKAKYEITVSAPKSVENVNIKTKDGIALFSWAMTKPFMLMM